VTLTLKLLGGLKTSVDICVALIIPCPWNKLGDAESAIKDDV
jgi:hypothetical protein